MESAVNIYIYAADRSCKDQKFYDWFDKAVKEMVPELGKYGNCNTRNGRALYIAPWNGEEEPMAASRQNDAQFHLPGNQPLYVRST